jgi:biopolymer transport protein ExbD
VRKREPALVDLTPLVDISFLLLVFFMLATQFKPPERVAVNLPLSRSEIHIPETNTIILTVDAAGTLLLSTERIADAVEVAPEDLLDAIRTWRSRNPEAVVVLRGDRDAEFGWIADAMDALAESETLRFNLMTDLERGDAAGGG